MSKKPKKDPKAAAAAEAAPPVESDAPVSSAPAAKAPPAPEAKPLSDHQRLALAESEIAELKADFIRLAELLGQQFGGPLASQAAEIAQKRQGPRG